MGPFLKALRVGLEPTDSVTISCPCVDFGGHPVWTKENRARYDRSGLRYESDLTDEEWAEIAPLIPPAKPGGNKRTVSLREVVNGLMYILSTGCQWRAIPKDLAARSTIYDYFDRWSWDGTLDRIHHTLCVKCRERASREASPTSAIIDAQSVKSAETSIRMAMTLARRSKARSGTSWSIPRVRCCMRSSLQPISRTATAGLCCWPRYSASIPSCSSSTRMAAIKDPSSAPPCEPSWRGWKWRSSNARIRPKASSSCRNAGWWKERWLGWAAAAVSPRIGRRSTTRPAPF